MLLFVTDSVDEACAQIDLGGTISESITTVLGARLVVITDIWSPKTVAVHTRIVIRAVVPVITRQSSAARFGVAQSLEAHRPRTAFATAPLAAVITTLTSFTFRSANL